MLVMASSSAEKAGRRAVRVVVVAQRRGCEMSRRASRGQLSIADCNGYAMVILGDRDTARTVQRKTCSYRSRNTKERMGSNASQMDEQREKGAGVVLCGPRHACTPFPGFGG
jgi:hypothetical protein